MRGTTRCGSTTKAQDDASAIEFMFALLEEFLAERGKHGGLRRVFDAYESWLRRQDWYDPSSPQWIAPEI